MHVKEMKYISLKEIFIGKYFFTQQENNLNVNKLFVYAIEAVVLYIIYRKTYCKIRVCCYLYKSKVLRKFDLLLPTYIDCKTFL